MVDGSAPRWNVQINGAVLPYYRFKAGPVGTTRCDVDEDYGPIMSVAAVPTIAAEITPTPGVYVLCVPGGTGTDVATAFTPLNSVAEVLTEVDEMPPPLPLPYDRSSGAFAFSPQYPDYVRFYYRLQNPGETDCRKLPSDEVIASESVTVMLGQELCVSAEDAAGNLSAPMTLSTSN